MNKFYKKLLAWITILVLGSAPFISFAEEPDSFLVKVEPDTFWVWQAVDITVTALKMG